MDRLDAWLTAAPEPLDDRDVQRWRAMLLEHLDDAVTRIVERMTDELGAFGGSAFHARFAGEGWVNPQAIQADLGALLDGDDEAYARALCGLGVITPEQADCGFWIDDWCRGEAEDAALAGAEGSS